MAEPTLPDSESGDKTDDESSSALVPVAHVGTNVTVSTSEARMTHDEFIATRMQMKLVLHGATLKCAVMLLDIRDREGWFYDYASFKDFVDEEFGKSRSRAYYLITYAEVVTAALPAGADLDAWTERVPTERRVRGLVSEYGKAETTNLLRALFTSGKKLPSPDGRPGDDLETIGDLLSQPALPPVRSVSSMEDTARQDDAAHVADGEFHATDKDDAPPSQREIASALHDDIQRLPGLARRVRQATDHANSKKMLRTALRSESARAYALEMIRTAMSALSELESAINLLDES